MKNRKDLLRRLYKIPESSGPGDPAVLGRKNYHARIAAWLSRWLNLLHAMFVVVGFVFILLPVLTKDWRSIVQATPIVSRIFFDYSNFTGLAQLNFFFLVAMYFLIGWSEKNFPALKTTEFTYKSVVEMELYPRTIREEISYCINLVWGFSCVTIWLFMPFGIIAFLIGTGS